MPYLHAPAKNRLTILARANGRDTTIALSRSDRVVGTCSSPATSISLPHTRDVPCAESEPMKPGRNRDRVGRGACARVEGDRALARADHAGVPAPVRGPGSRPLRARAGMSPGAPALWRRARVVWSGERARGRRRRSVASGANGGATAPLPGRGQCRPGLGQRVDYDVVVGNGGVEVQEVCLCCGVDHRIVDVRARERADRVE